MDICKHEDFEQQEFTHDSIESIVNFVEFIQLEFGCTYEFAIDRMNNYVVGHWRVSFAPLPGISDGVGPGYHSVVLSAAS